MKFILLIFTFTLSAYADQFVESFCKGQFKSKEYAYPGLKWGLVFHNWFDRAGIVKFETLPHDLEWSNKTAQKRAMLIFVPKEKVSRKERKKLRRKRKAVTKQQKEILKAFRKSELIKKLRAAKTAKECVEESLKDKTYFDQTVLKFYSLAAKSYELYTKTLANRLYRMIKKSKRKMERLGYKVIWESDYIKAYNQLPKDPDDVIIVAHASPGEEKPKELEELDRQNLSNGEREKAPKSKSFFKGGFLFDGNKKRLPLGYLKSFGDNLKRLTIYSCHNQAVIRRYSIGDLSSKVETKVVKPEIHVKEFFTTKVPFIGMKALKRVALTPLRESKLAPKQCSITFEGAQINSQQGVYINGYWAGTLKRHIPISCDQEIRFIAIHDGDQLPGTTRAIIDQGTPHAVELKTRTYKDGRHKVSAARVIPHSK